MPPFKPHEHVCDKLCFVCQRPYDTFSHVHIQPHDATPSNEPPAEVVFCIPCMAALSAALAQACAAYVNGGYAFDRYGHARAAQHTAGRRQPYTPLPTWAVEVMQQLINQETDDADE